MHTLEKAAQEAAEKKKQLLTSVKERLQTIAGYIIAFKWELSLILIPCVLYGVYLLGKTSNSEKIQIMFPEGTKSGEASIKFKKSEKIENDDAIITAYKKKDNDQAPKEVTSSNAIIKYVIRFKKVCQIESEKFGIPFDILMCQGLVESGAGQSWLARNANNHFGMKCFSKTCPKGHCVPRKDDHARDRFYKYPSAWNSWRMHSLLLSNNRYEVLKKPIKIKKMKTKYATEMWTLAVKNQKDPFLKWAYGLAALGYATDRTYAKKLINTREKY